MEGYFIECKFVFCKIVKDVKDKERLKRNILEIIRFMRYEIKYNVFFWLGIWNRVEKRYCWVSWCNLNEIWDVGFLMKSFVWYG